MSAVGAYIFGLLGLAPSQAPQTAHREDDGEERGHAHREECPDEEETPLRLVPKPIPAPLMWMTGTPINRSDARRMMTYRDRRSASTSVSVQLDDADDHRKEVWKPSR